MENVAIEQTVAAPRTLAKVEQRSTKRARTAGKALGVVSLGLGLVELLAPKQVASLIGLPNSAQTRFLLRAFGARELLAAAGLLGQPVTASWLWSRVAGDAMDLALLLGSTGSRKDRKSTRLNSSHSDRSRMPSSA